MSLSQLTLNLVEGSVSFSFSPQAARELQAAISQLMTRLKAVAAKTVPTGKASPQPPLEYRYTGEVFLEVFCNPNIWPSPFAAKVLASGIEKLDNSLLAQRFNTAFLGFCTWVFRSSESLQDLDL